MSQPEIPLYPKLSSIYNKIMQLAIAIFCIVLLMNLSLFSREESQESIEKNFDYSGEQYLLQAARSVEVLLAKNNRKDLQLLANQLSESELIRDLVVYGNTGQVIVKSDSSKQINDLYGVSINQLNQSDEYIPFVRELTDISDNTLKGYIRITVAKVHLTKSLSRTSDEQHNLMRLMLLVAGVVGFLLTRGFNRFSRQGYRLAQSK